MSGQPIVALLGRRDEPTDGVADYCDWLGAALRSQGYDFAIQRVNWAEGGWRAALAELRERAAAWRDRWVLLQFTQLAWSRRGFPLRAPEILSILREHGVRCGVVFHDFAPYEGSRAIDRARALVQSRALRQLYQRADRAIFPVPLELISWLPGSNEKANEKAAFIPVGANCPALPSLRRPAGAAKTIAIHSVTGGSSTAVEIADIACAMKRARTTAGSLKLVVLGRGSQEADAALRAGFAGTDIAIETLGLLPAEKVSETLAAADVLLFVRGQISSRRGSALAGIACGLPVVCYAGPETSGPITEAGIMAVPLRDREALAAALERVLADDALRQSLAERSRYAQQRYFSWPAIAAQFATVLHNPAAIEQQRRSEASAQVTAVARR